jgi:hypothetical protein
MDVIIILKEFIMIREYFISRTDFFPSSETINKHMIQKWIYLLYELVLNLLRNFFVSLSEELNCRLT